MTEKQTELTIRVARALKITYAEARNTTLQCIIHKLLDKIENDCIDIDDMVNVLENMKVER